VLIAGLRKKIESGEGRRYIHNEPWIGYRFQPDGTTDQ
jgi:two-component system KDP operon response regulator KdpE